MEQTNKIENVCNLIQTTCIPIHKKLNKQKQIEFAYKYWNEANEDITKLYEFLVLNKNNENEKLAADIGQFINMQFPTSIVKITTQMYSKNTDYILKTTKQIRESGNWLSLYNLENEFNKTSINSHPIRYSYLLKSGEIFSIDKTKAKDILGILTENNIPTAKCIVTSGFPYYAQDNMDTYIQKIKTIK